MDANGAARATCALLAVSEPVLLLAMAEALRGVWLQAAPSHVPVSESGPAGFVRDWGIDDPDYEAVGTPVPVLAAVGKEIGKVARGRVEDYLPLADFLWQEYGREGRIVAAVAMGPMELADPETVVPVLYEMAQTCVFWEDCDQLAMKALEPVLRKDPDTWIERLGRWVTDDNKWVRRAGLTAVGRLPMVHADRTARCVELEAPALGDPDRDVKRALSFALRVNARGDVAPVKAFILGHQDLTDAHSLWVLCDLIRSMTRSLLPRFVDLLPVYAAWLETAEPSARRGVQGAVRTLERARS